MAAVFRAVAGDQTTKVRPTIKDAQTKAVVSLTGVSAVKILFKYRHSSTVTTKDMVVVDPAGGICEYQFASNELVAGYMDGEVEITKASKINITRKFHLNVEPRVSAWN